MRFQVVAFKARHEARVYLEENPAESRKWRVGSKKFAEGWCLILRRRG